MFVELHAHSDKGSNTRLIDSTAKVGAMISHANSLGLNGIAITDHESLSAHMEAIECYEDQIENKKDFKLILGNEIYLVNGGEHYKETITDFYHFVLLAKDRTGYQQLMELSDRAWGRMYTYKGVERVPTFIEDIVEIVSKNAGHVVAMTACLGGYVPKSILSGKPEKAISFMQWCESVFGAENFFVELQPGITYEQIEVNKELVRLCKEHGHNWIITNDVHYLTKEKRELHAAFLNSKQEDRETEDFYENTYFKSEDEMLERMLPYLSEKDIRSGFENTVLVANQVESYSLKQPVHIPQRVLYPFDFLGKLKEKNVLERYQYIKLFYESEYDQDRFLLYLVEKGMIEKQQNWNDENLSRIDVELKQLWEISLKLKQRMSSYYNLVQYVIEIMWDDEKGNSLVGIARGSGTGFYLCYLIDITQINPIEWDLPYWRHLSSQRPELPDLDIDSQASQRPKIFQALREEFGYNKTLNIITFRKETSKAAILTACRGLGIDTDIARELSSMVPISRGRVWGINECLKGNEENGFSPLKEFIRKISEHELLLETVLEIEGLVSGRSSHASGFYIFSNPYIEQVGRMKTPTGLDVTCWDMDDADKAGCLKIDVLTILALDKERKAMSLMLDSGRMQWQGSLKNTYKKYLHPDSLDYTSPKMWDMVCNGQIYDLFQFDTMVGKQAVQKIQPRSLKQLSLGNSAMRLMSDGEESPIERYVRFSKDISQWYQEMQESNLNKEEILILEKHLLRNNGCSLEQEDIMELSMDTNIAGFDVVLANKLRKAIAKKKEALIKESCDQFYKCGKTQDTRKEMLDYVWNYCVKPQIGYAFSRNHTMPYSAIALQEMNLAYHYPILYWNTACLTINSSSDDEVEDNKSTNYGKIAKAIGDMQSQRIKIALPDINTANFGFYPDEEQDQIVFGLKGINGIGDDVASEIISNRPYESVNDFLGKVKTTFIQTTNLVKAGCFDRLRVDRMETMKEFVVWFTKQNVEPKTTLNMQNFKSILSLDILPKEFDSQKRLYNFKTYVLSKEFMYEKDWYWLDQAARSYFELNVISHMKENTEYKITQDGIVINKKQLEKFYQKQVAPIKQWLSKKETVEFYNRAQNNSYANEKWSKYCIGTIPKWEMDSLSFYYTDHELSGVNVDYYEISDYFEIPNEPIIDEIVTRKTKQGKEVEYPKYKLNKIIGTVLDKDTTRHTVTLLTTTGVVVVKFYDGAFVAYNKQISAKDSQTGKKKVIEKPWFTRGNKLLITGIKKNDMFYPKRYRDSIYQHTVCLIESIAADGRMEMKYERERA